MYVDFVEDVAPLSMKLREEHDVKAGSFYGRGLSGHDKDEVLKSWRAGVIKVMVATKAFGLGVNQSDVQLGVNGGKDLNIWVRNLYSLNSHMPMCAQTHTVNFGV